MSLLSLVKNLARPGFARRATPGNAAAKSSLAGPMIAWSSVGHWLTPMFDEHLQLDFDPDQVSALTPRRDAQWNKLNNAHFLTRNEQREAAGYGPVPGGDVFDGDPVDDDGVDDNSPAGFGPDFDPDGEAVVTPRNPFAPGYNPHRDPDTGRFTFPPDDPANDDDDN